MTNNMKIKGTFFSKERESEVAQSCPTLCSTWTVVYQAPLSMGFSRQEYWSGCRVLLQGILPTQGSNPGLPHCGQTLYHLSHQESQILCVWDFSQARILVWVAISLSLHPPKKKDIYQMLNSKREELRKIYGIFHSFNFTAFLIITSDQRLQINKDISI